MEHRVSRSDQFLTIKDVADLLSVHPMTIYKLLKQESMPGARFGGVWRFSRREIDKWEKDQEARNLHRTFSNSRSAAVKRRRKTYTHLTLDGGAPCGKFRVD